MNNLTLQDDTFPQPVIPTNTGQVHSQAFAEGVADEETVRRTRCISSDGAGDQPGAVLGGWLQRYSVTLLRISMGAVILGFGVLKYFPGVSPAENLVLTVNRLLTFGFMPDNVALILFATVECVVGLSLITGWGLRVCTYPLAIWAVGILSPIVLLPGRLFSGPNHAPTLEGQYVLKDVILLAASLVIATHVHSRTTQAARLVNQAQRDALHLRYFIPGMAMAARRSTERRKRSAETVIARPDIPGRTVRNPS